MAGGYAWKRISNKWVSKSSSLGCSCICKQLKLINQHLGDIADERIQISDWVYAMPDNTMSFLNVYLYPKNHYGPVTNSGDNVDQKILQYDWCTSIPDQTYPNEE